MAEENLILEDKTMIIMSKTIGVLSTPAFHAVGMLSVSNPFAFPILVILWSIEAWLWLAVLMIVMERLCPANHLVSSLKILVNPIFGAAKTILSKCIRREIPELSLRLVTFLIVVMLRYLLISLIVTH
jgi:hypothetical protein